MCVHTAEKIRFYYVMMLELGQGAGGKAGMVVLSYWCGQNVTRVN